MLLVLEMMGDRIIVEIIRNAISHRLTTLLKVPNIVLIDVVFSLIDLKAVRCHVRHDAADRYI
jgi:hypothetical protein